MQDRYAGDVGDFGKLALLRALLAGSSRLGVCWYMTAGADEKNNDGRHLDFLDRPDRFRSVDPVVFDALRTFQSEFATSPNRRSVASLEALELLPSSTRFHSTPVPSDASRARWIHEMSAAVADCDLIFLDPDNGLETKRLGIKSAALAEIAALRRSGRTLVLYHHQTRVRGGADVEAGSIARRLRSVGADRVDALRLRAYSSRFYFVMDATPPIVESLKRFRAAWLSRDADLVLHEALAG